MPRIEKTCPQCGRTHTNKTYCSIKCSNNFRTPKIYPIQRPCPACGLDYTVDKYNYETKYCSIICANSVISKKYSISTDLSNPFLLGQIWASGVIIDYRQFRLYNSLEVLSSISHGLLSTYKINGTRSEVYDNYFKAKGVIVIYNSQIVDKLVDLGLADPPYREWPWIPPTDYMSFFDGYLSASEVIVKGDQTWIKMVSRSMAYEAGDLFNLKVMFYEGWWYCILPLTSLR